MFKLKTHINVTAIEILKMMKRKGILGGVAVPFIDLFLTLPIIPERKRNQHEPA